jgi:regulator of cell morphogenesis and NO signaling
MNDITTATLKDIVLEDFRAAAVFERFALDFCCGGNKTVAQACAERSMEAEPVVTELRALGARTEADGGRFARMELDELADYIVATHHAYVRAALPVLLAHTAKVASVHGANHPEAVAIAELTQVVAEEMDGHMMKEEMVLFPYIKRLAEARRAGRQMAPPHFGSVRNPIRMMESEHDSAGGALRNIRDFSANYTPPEDACTTFRVTYRELQEFEEDLHRHVHLENNILFPKTIALETELLSKAN